MTQRERNDTHDSAGAHRDDFRGLFDANPSAMWVFNPVHQTFLDANQAAIDRFGFSREEYLGMPAARILPDLSATEFEQQGPGSQTVRTVLQTKSSEVRNVELTVLPARFGGEMVFALLAIDVTERGDLQKNLWRHVEHERLTSAMTRRFSTLDGHDLDSAIDDSLRGLGETVGVDRSWIITFTDDGTNASMTWEWCAEGIDAWKTRFKRIPSSSFPWARGLLERFEEIRVPRVSDLPSEAAEGRRYNEEKGNLSVLAVPILCAGKLIGILGLDSVRHENEWAEETVALLRVAGEIFGNSLERRRAEQARRESESRLRTLVQQMREGLSRVNLDHVIEFVNDAFCEMLGYTASELIGRKATDLLLTDADRELMIEQTKRRSQGLSDRYEVRLQRKNGETAWIEIGGAPVTDALGLVIGSIGVHTDITERKKADDALRASEERYRLLAENSTDMISRHATDGRFLYASGAAMSLLQHIPESLAGRPLLDLIHPDDLLEASACYERILHPPFSLTFSYRIRRNDGVWVWFETTSRALRNPENGEIHEIICVSRDVTDRRLVEAEFEYLAYHDGLTRLPNRVLFHDRLTVALAHCRRNRERLTVMFLDLDRFKLVNDTLGHSVGDKLLERIAERLSLALREQDTVARIGGDEFTILLSGIDGEEDAAKIAQKILSVVAQPVELANQSIHSTVSIGIALYPNDGDEAETLLRNADVAMYRAKELGRNNYQLCTPAMNRRAAERLTLEHSLHRALENGEFRLLYQPQVNVKTGIVTGVEALVRWHDPDRGVVSPSEFIPIAEEIRLIIPIGEWILSEATRQIGHWHRNGHPGLRLAVNLSPLQFQQQDLTTMVNRILRANRFDSHLLEFEITESTAMQNIDLTVTLLRRMREMGLTFSIDDFGTGHSSLNYLKRFPIDAIKIDQSFVRDVDTDRSSAAIVAAIIAMAEGLDLRVIAEGVETKAQLDALAAHHCEDMQGFYFCKPLSAEELGPVLEDFRAE